METTTEITPEQKINILKGARNYILNGYPSNTMGLIQIGLCMAIRKSLLPTLKVEQINFMITAHIRSLEPFGIMEYEPDLKELDGTGFWFPLNEEGKKKRLSILDERIEFYQSQLK